MIEIDRLADRPDLLLPLVQVYERAPGWYCVGAASAEADLRDRSNRDCLPLGLVAHANGVPIGACALTPEAGPIETALTPWLGGLWVEPEWRARGVATRMVDLAALEARRLGFDRVYALTVNAEGLMLRAGWHEMDRVNLEGQDWAVLSKETHAH